MISEARIPSHDIPIRGSGLYVSAGSGWPQKKTNGVLRFTSRSVSRFASFPPRFGSVVFAFPFFFSFFGDMGLTVVSAKSYLLSDHGFRVFASLNIVRNPLLFRRLFPFVDTLLPQLFSFWHLSSFFTRHSLPSILCVEPEHRERVMRP